MSSSSASFNTGSGVSTLVERLRCLAAERPEAPLYTWLDETGEVAATLDRGGLDRRARAVARYLWAGVGLGSGDRALLLFPPGLEFITAFLGCLYAGVVAVPAYPPRGRRSLPRLDAIVGDAEPAAVLTTGAVLPRVRSWLEDRDGSSHLALAAVDEVVESIDDGALAAWEAPAVGAADLAFLQYTSGSTSTPKGVRVTHGNLVHNEEMIRRAFAQSEESVIVSWLPLYHDMGLIGGVLQPLYLGARCILTSPAAFLRRPRLWLEAVDRYRATTSGGPDFGYELVLAKVPEEEREGLDLSSWKVAFNGSEPVRADTLERFRRAFEPHGFSASAFYPCYGLAEATLFVTGGEAVAEPVTRGFDGAALEDHRAEPARGAGARRLVGCGRPWRGQRLEIVDPDSREPLPAGRVGEVWVTGPSVADGYWNRDEESAEAFGARLAGDDEGDRFLRTGDLGFLADDGELFVTGRRKDLIILRGRNLYPQDVERSAQAAHPSIRAGGCAAFSARVDGEERLVVACEMGRRFPTDDPAAVRRVAEAVREAVYAELEAAVFEVVPLTVGRLPKTTSGKVRRRACRDAYLSDAGMDGAIRPEAGEETAAKKAEEAAAARGAEPPATDLPAPGAAELAGLEPAVRRERLAAYLAARAARALRRAPEALATEVALTAQGLESLSAAELLAVVEDELGLALDHADLLEGASVAELAERVAERLEAAATDATDVDEEEAAPRFVARGARPEESALSPGQAALWFLQRMDPESAAYHISVAADVEGPLDAAALGRALTALARRHRQLRATFHGRAGEPVQRVAPPSAAADHVEVVRAEAGSWGAGEVAERLRAEALRPFDLASGPLLRLVLLRRDAQRHALLLTVHHLVADFWSLVVLFRELESLYLKETGELSASEAADALAEPAATFADFVGWQERLLEGPEGRRLETWWRRALDDGALADLDLPTDRPRPPVLSDRGGAVSATLEAAGEAAAALAGELGTTPFAVTLAAFQAVLARYSGQRDFLLGTPVAGRGPRELAGVVGYLVNPVVLRAGLAAGDDGRPPGLGELARRAAAGANAAFDHQAFPFPRLTAALRPVRDPGRSPLFQVFFSYQTPPGGRHELAPFALGVEGGRLSLGPLSLRSRRLERPPAQFDLNLMLAGGAEDGPLRATAVYNRDLFDADTVERLLGHLGTLLAAGARHPETQFTDLPLLTAAEREQLTTAWNDTAAAIPEPGTVHALFEAIAAAGPDRLAVTDGEVEWTYGELASRAHRLARHLRRRGVGRGTVVGVYVERSARMVEALLGILEAGGTYLPLDPSYPTERVAYTLADSGAALVLTEDELAEGLADGVSGGGYGGALLRLDGEAEAVAAEDDAPLTTVAGGDDAAYLIYTSGSTGRPKGVVVPHRAMVNFLATMVGERPGLGADDVFFSITTLSFDIVGLELFGPLAVGARVHVADRATAADGTALARALDGTGATVMQATPTTWRLLVDAGWKGERPLVALSGGELLPRGLAAEVARRASALWNMYGPTETTVWSSVAEVPAPLPAPPAAEEGAESGAVDASGPVSIGTPVANTRVEILDRRGRPVPAGVPGELWIGGAGLARGYHRRPALTAERFAPDPLADSFAEPGARLYRTGDLARWRGDGTLAFLGRLDHQVKVRGVRIELGEIEAALVRHPAVASAVAGVLPGTAGASRLVAWLVAEGSEPPGVRELRDFLGLTLPAPYLPSAFVTLDELPLTPNGKVDRKALPAPEGARPDLDSDFAAPASALEEEVAALWRELLGVDRVGVDDNFFDLGGHSLLVSRLHARLTAAGHELEMVELFRYPTVAALAGRLAEGAGTDGAATARGEAAARSRLAARGAATEAAERSTDVAVIGYAGRFPGADGVRQLWRRLAAGDELISTFSQDELREAGVDDELLADPAYVPAAAVLDRPARFDAAFFGYTPREAQLMDPQHRVFLECAWQALEDAGYDPRRMPGRVGVFAGVGLNTYLLHCVAPHTGGLRPGRSMAGGYQAFVGNDKDFVPTRVSYELDLKGPSVNVQTACSSSLVAVHLACQSLLAGEADAALAGGVTIRVPFREGYLHEEGGIPSPDGHCRPFDERAAGTVLGSGAGIVVLKRLADALADGDPIRAVVKGSAINNDGSGKMGYTAPSVDGQAAVIREALAVAGASPRSIGYVEAHGTGTAMGDPIEVAALAEAFGGAGAEGSGGEAGWCRLGSVKSNLGHLDTAAGVTGLIKAILALEHGLVPPTLHYSAPNPKIDFAGGPFRVAAAAEPWERNGAPRRAGVSSFGIGGTNAHVVLEEAPCREAGEEPAPRPWQLLPVSARTESALRRAGEALAGALADDDAGGLADVAWTLQVGRHAMAHRAVALAADRASAAAVLRGEKDADGGARLLTGTAPAKGERREVAFLLPGQGSQHPGAGRRLYRSEPVFRHELERVCDLFAPHLGFDLRELLVASDADDAAAAERLRRTEVAQPAIFALELALARLWSAWGVTPAALLGHSLGEYVAATLAGVFELTDAVALVAARGRLMGGLPEGDMLAVEPPAGDAAPGPDAWTDELFADLGLAGELALAAVNGPADWVVSGAAPAVAVLAERLKADGVRHRVLHTSHAFHSPMMEPILDAFTAEVAARPRRAPRIPLASNLSGDWLGAEEAADPAYWARHLRGAVRFAAGLDRLLEDAPERLLLEVGPGRALTQLARRNRPGATTVASLPHPRDPQPEEASLTEAVGRLWLAGAEVDWRAYAGDRGHRRVPLPAYPFEGDDHLLPVATLAAAGEAPQAPAASRADDPADWFYVPLWQQAPTPADPAASALAEAGPWLLVADVAAGDDRPCVLARTAERLRAAGAEVATAAAGDGFTDLEGSNYTVDPASRDDWSSLAHALAAAGRRPRRVVHGLNLAPGPSLAAPADPAADAPLAERTRAARVPAFHSLLHLAAALEETGALAAAGGVELVAVARGTARLAGEPAAVLRPERALLTGALRALPQDAPGLTCRVVDLESAGGPAAVDAAAVEDLAADLLAELGAGLGPGRAPARVAWRDGLRHVEGFEPSRLADADCAAGTPALRDGGAYWITGGLGGVGLALAGDLARRHGARLLLSGRSALPPREEWPALLAAADEPGAAGRPDADPATVERVRRLRELEAAGAEVLYVAADATDPEATAAALAAAEARFGRLDGVVHAAGVPGGGLAQVKSAEDAERVLAPKVEGAVVLGELLGDRLAAGDLGFLLFCSSINAVVGGFGQTDYAAANAFLDAYAESLPRRRGSRALAVAWDRWSGVGMAADATGDLLATLAGSGAAAHPLLGARVPAGAGRHVWAGELSPQRHWALSEHRVLGVPTLPGTSYLEMARAAWAEAAGGPVAMSEVAFLAPLMVVDGHRRRVLTVLEDESPETGGPELHFRVVSQAGGDADGAWVEHVRARLHVPAEDGDAARPGRRDPEALAAACDRRHLTADDVAAAAAAAMAGDASGGDGDDAFLATGLRWSALKSLAVGEGQALARFELDRRFADDLAATPLHPALLDVAAGAIRFLADGDYLPLAYERLTVHGPLPASGWSHLTVRGGAVGEPGGELAATDGGILSCDLAVIDDAGDERVVVRGFTMRRVPRDNARALVAEARAAAEGVDAAPTAGEGATPRAPGLSAAEGVDAFRRILAGPPVPRWVVSTRDLEVLRREVARFDRDRVAEELAALAAAGPAAAGSAVQGSGGELGGDLERRIAAVWQRVLGVERIGADDNFFELGGTSLAGIQLIAELKKELGTDIPTVTIFEAPTVAALARHLAPDEDAEKVTDRAHDRAEKKHRALAARRRAPRPAARRRRQEEVA